MHTGADFPAINIGQPILGGKMNYYICTGGYITDSSLKHVRSNLQFTEDCVESGPYPTIADAVFENREYKLSLEERRIICKAVSDYYPCNAEEAEDMENILTKLENEDDYEDAYYTVSINGPVGVCYLYY